MHFQRSALAFFVSFACCLPAYAKAKQQITTDHFRILYDKSMHLPAQRVASTLETLYAPLSKTLPGYPRPIRLWLNSNSTVSNAFFMGSPRYIYFNTFAPSDPYFLGNAEWLRLLCIHEYRHAVQNDIQYRSIPAFLQPFMHWSKLILFLVVPPFFYEGDAVAIETALTKSGRGRFPGWERLYKVNLLERKPATLNKQLYRSYNHEVPDHYLIGYYLVTHIRRKYGSQAIRTIYQQSVQGFPFFGFYDAVYKATGKSLFNLYKELNEELLAVWRKQLEGLPITPATPLTVVPAKDSVDYTQPFMDSRGNVMAIKNGLGVRPQLVKFCLSSSGLKAMVGQPSAFTRYDEKRMWYCSAGKTAHFAIGENGIAWLEYYRHPWKKILSNNNHIMMLPNTDLCMRLQYYDYKRKKRRTLVSNRRYHAVAISPSGRQLVVVASDAGANHYLGIVDTQSGKEVEQIAYEADGYYLTPSWDGEEHVVVVQTKDQQNSILRINIHTGIKECLLSPSYEHRNTPKVYRDYLLYNSSYNGIDNIYAMHLPTKVLFQVTSRKYGAYLGMVDPIGHQLIFSDFAKTGMAIVSMPFDPSLWLPLEKVTDRSVRYYQPIVQQENNAAILEKVPSHNYPVTNYRWKDGLLWDGFFPIVSPNQRNLYKRNPHAQCALFSLSHLEGDFLFQLYCNLFRSSKVNGKKKAKPMQVGVLLHKQLGYPIVEGGIELDHYKEGGIELDHYEKGGWGWRLRGGILFPYCFTWSTFTSNIALGIHLLLESNVFNNYTPHTFPEFSLYLQNASTKSERDIYPPWLQAVETKYALHSFPSLKGKIEINPILFFPGFFNHHYLNFAPSVHVFVKNIDKYNSWKRDYSIKYGFPLAYPDWSIPPLPFLLKRIRFEGYYCYNYKEHEHNLGGWAYFDVGLLYSYVANIVACMGLGLGWRKTSIASSRWEFEPGFNFQLR